MYINCLHIHTAFSIYISRDVIILFPAARLAGIVGVGVAYPATPPCFAIIIEDNGTKESGNIQTKVGLVLVTPMYIW